MSMSPLCQQENGWLSMMSSTTGSSERDVIKTALKSELLSVPASGQA